MTSTTTPSAPDGDAVAGGNDASSGGPHSQPGDNDLQARGPQPGRRRTRAERQRETRAALVESALLVFARDGYHGANLEVIANQAGYSKGAVYSNFASKAELFLAVMDRNLAQVQSDAWDPFEPILPAAPAVLDMMQDGPDEMAVIVRGLGLATLEFIATAARDEEFGPALTQRVQILLNAYRGLASAAPADGEPLAAEQVAVLLTALDQGLTVLALTGIAAADAALLRTGLRRLLDPSQALDPGAMDSGDTGGERAGGDAAQERARPAPG